VREDKTTSRFGRAQHGDRVELRAVEQARNGEEAGLRFLYMRYERDVYRYVRSILHDGHDAEDVTQNVFTKLSQALVNYEPRAVPFSAWILRVARNAALDRLRARATLPLDELGSAPAAWDDTTHLERRACLHQALAALPAEQRQVVLMRHVVGLTTPEIAAALGRTEGSVHALHHRGRAGLRRRLGELGIAPAVNT
jgi:RNA polymerase sigma-70 factor (ECF subfamily)